MGAIPNTWLPPPRSRLLHISLAEVREKGDCLEANTQSFVDKTLEWQASSPFTSQWPNINHAPTSSRKRAEALTLRWSACAYLTHSDCR